VNEDKAARYQRLKRQASVISLAWGVLLLAGLVWTGWTATLRDAAAGVVSPIVPLSWQPGAIVLGYVVFLSLLNEIWALPLSFYNGFFLERRYDLSNETLGGWLRDQAKSFGIGLVLAGVSACLIYWCIRQSPELWWVPAGLLFTLLIVGLTNVAPVVLLPLFYSVKPLSRDALRTRLVGLADRAGAPVLGAYEWGLGGKTKKANAALAGLGGTRRILVSDTMLAEYSDDEIEVVLAHEIAHHVHGDIWKGIVFESVLIVAGFYLASRVLMAMAGPAGPAAAVARGRRGLDRDGAGGACAVARLRAQRRPVRARPDAQSGCVHLSDAPPRRAEPRGRGSVANRAVAVL
jgi:STE24 endopeptidase